MASRRMTPRPGAPPDPSRRPSPAPRPAPPQPRGPSPATTQPRSAAPTPAERPRSTSLGKVQDDTHAEVLYGYRAALAVVEKRPEDVSEVLFAGELRSRLGDLHRWAQRRGISVREAPEAELARLAGTTNHEGLCVRAKGRRWLSPGELAEQLVERRGAAIALDRVRNPYNIGAILRSAAFFGLEGAILGAPAPHPALAPDAVRVAEGGAEHLLLSRTTDLAETLARLKGRGVRVIGAESDGTAGLAGYPFERPAVVVLGNEREGLGDRIRAQCDELVVIRGGGAVGSLNVSIAASLVIAELVRPPQPATGAGEPRGEVRGDRPRGEARPAVGPSRPAPHAPEAPSALSRTERPSHRRPRGR